MSDSTRRALRTLVQGLSGGAITSVLDLFVIELTDVQVAGLSVVLTVVASALMNFLEDKKVIPAAFYPKGLKPGAKKK